MITCTLNGKKYVVDYVKGRALREIDDAANMYRRLVQVSQDAAAGKDVSGENITIAEAMDVMVKWFCILFDNQFTPEDVYDYYPADSIMRDVSTAILAVQQQTTDILSDFPMKPTAAKTAKKKSR